MNNQLKEYIDKATNIVAFTGAGISTESGIPDFRSVGGLYTSGEFEGMSPEDILSRQTLRKNPKILISFYKKRLINIVDKNPNPAHFGLVELEKQGKLSMIVTQNIDGLHKKAGSKNICELHGNATTFRCSLGCKANYSLAEFEQLTETQEVPKCPRCGFGIIRPNTVLFNESLDDATFDCAFFSIKKADLLIVIGCSLLVQPAASLVAEKSTNCKLIMINKDSTPYDHLADLILRENCGEVFSE